MTKGPALDRPRSLVSPYPFIPFTPAPAACRMRRMCLGRRVRPGGFSGQRCKPQILCLLKDVALVVIGRALCKCRCARGLSRLCFGSAEAHAASTKTGTMQASPCPCITVTLNFWWSVRSHAAVKLRFWVLSGPERLNPQQTA